MIESAACCPVHALGKCDAVFTCCDRCPTFFGPEGDCTPEEAVEAVKAVRASAASCPGADPEGWVQLGQTAPVTFSGVSDGGEPFVGTFTTHLYECPTCFAVVAAREPHRAWHEETDHA